MTAGADAGAPSSRLARWRDAAARAASAAVSAASFDWLSLGRVPAAAALAALVVGLALAVGLSSAPLTRAVPLGVEFGGGLRLLYAAEPRAKGAHGADGKGAPAPAAVAQQAVAMYQDCVSQGHSNAVVQYYAPSSINVIVPAVSSTEQVAPLLAAFNKHALALKLRFSDSLSGVLGAEDLRASLVAGAIAMGIVWAVLLLRYRAAGVLGLFFTIVFLWLLLALFVASRAVLSEAAVMALILNVGLAADAHILTFERAREEMHLLPAAAPEGERLAALLTGQRAALVTVLEASATSVLAMGVLYAVGAGPVQDFAYLTLISIAASFLVNVLLARLATRLAWSAGLVRTAAFFGDKGPAHDEEEAAKKCSLVRLWRPRRRLPFNLLNWWFIGAAATIAVITAGAVYLGQPAKHPLNLDVDFTSGTALDLKLPPGDFAADDVAATAEGAGDFSVATSALGAGGRVALRFDDALQPDDVQTIVKAMEDAYGKPVSFVDSTVDPAVARALVRQAITAIVASAAAVTAFLLLAFGPAFAVAGFVGLASSGVFSLCCFALGGFEIDVTFVAAVLTVFCYAVNDAVVVFDRIRSELARGAAPRDAVNAALACVTIRSLLTLMAVLVPSLCLAFMGAEPLHAFALAITFGLISVCYSTLLIVAPLWYALRAAGDAARGRLCGRRGAAAAGAPVAPGDEGAGRLLEA